VPIPGSPDAECHIIGKALPPGRLKGVLGSPDTTCHVGELGGYKQSGQACLHHASLGASAEGCQSRQRAVNGELEGHESGLLKVLV
jgi:hypothetical protein